MYVPEIGLGKPTQEEHILHEVVQDVTIWYHPQLVIKQEYTAIRISLRPLWIMKWLELEGARGYTVLPPRHETT